MNEFMKPITLENWCLVYDGRLHGNSYGHARFIDGSQITTSSIVKLDKHNRLVYTKSGSVYKLGKVNEDYNSVFQNSEDRFWATQI